MLVHATTIDLAGMGVLITGEAGAGKSDLAMQLIAEGALLVADDQTIVEIQNDTLRAYAPPSIFGLIEVRGVGIAWAPVKRAARLRLAVLLTQNQPARMPERRTWSLPGTETPSVPFVEINGLDGSAPAKLRFALSVVLNA